MSSRTAGVGLRDEAGSSSANSRVKRAAVSSSLPEYFGNEENHEARGLTARRPKPQPSASNGGRCRQAPPGAVSAGSNIRNSASGGSSFPSGSGASSPATVAVSVTPTVDSKRVVFAGGRTVPDGKPRRGSSRAPLAGTSYISPAAAANGGSRTARPRPRRQPPPPPSHSPRSRLEGSNKMPAAVCWGKGGGSGGASASAAAVGDGGTSFSRAASRVALRAAQAKGLAVALPAALCVPSRLMDSTVASRAGVYAPPSVGKDGSASAMASASAGAGAATPRRFTTPRRRRSLGGGGVVAGVSGGGGAAATAASPTGAASTADAVSASDDARELAGPCDITSTSSGGGGSSGRKRELQERTGCVHVSDDEVPPHSASGSNSFVPTVSSAIGVPKRGRSAGAALVLFPPTRCHDKLSTELEAKAMRCSIGRSSNSSISSIHSAGGVSLGGDGDDGRLWKPSSSLRGARPDKSLDEAVEVGGQGTRGVEESLSAGGSAASFWSEEALYSRGGVENAMFSSLDSSWSMASVDETARQPNARESHASGRDPVARMLLCQSDDYDYGLDSPDNSSHGSAGGGGFSPPGPETISSLGVNPAAAMAAAAGGEGGGASGGGGACREWGIGGRSSPTLFASCAAGGAAVKVSLVKRAEAGRGFGECRGDGVFSSVRREGFGDVKSSENCLFRPFAFHRPS